MAITKFTDDKSNNKYEEVIPSADEEMDSMQLFLKKLADKTDEGLDKTNEHINKIITIGSNTTISFGDMVFTTDPKSGKTTTSIVMTVVYTDPSSSKVTTKTTTLTLA